MRRATRWRGALLVIFFFFFCALPAAAGATVAQERARDRDVEQHQLSFRAYESLGPGEYSLVEGTTGAAAHEFYADGLDVLQPIGVVLQARDPGADLRLELRSYSWTGPIREAATDESGRAAFRLRTSPDLYVRVLARDGAEEPYQLAVWKGPPVTPGELGRSLEPAVVPASEHEGGSGGADDGAEDREGGSSPLTSSAVLGTLLLCGVVAAVLVVRKRGAR